MLHATHGLRAAERFLSASMLLENSCELHKRRTSRTHARPQGRSVRTPLSSLLSSTCGERTLCSGLLGLLRQPAPAPSEDVAACRIKSDTALLEEFHLARGRKTFGSKSLMCQ